MYNPTFEQTTKFLKEDVYALYNLLMDSNGEIVDLDLTEIKNSLISIVSALDSLQEYGSEKTLNDLHTAIGNIPVPIIQEGYETIQDIIDAVDNISIPVEIAVNNLPVLQETYETLQDVIDTITSTKKDELAVASGDKNVTTAGSEEALSADGVCTSVGIQAKTTNTGSIYVGTSSARPFTLEAKDFISLPCTNLNQVYIDSSVSGEGVGYVALGVVS